MTSTPPPATETVQITRAEYRTSKKTLTVEATSTRTTSVLDVYVTSTGARIGRLRNMGGGRYSGSFSWPSNPGSVTVKSSGGGSATATVTAR